MLFFASLNCIYTIFCLVLPFFDKFVLYFLVLETLYSDDLGLFICYRDTGPEGWRLRQRHFEAITSLVRSCRRFFPPGSAFEIWSEFRSVLWGSLSLILLICLKALKLLWIFLWQSVGSIWFWIFSKWIIYDSIS